MLKERYAIDSMKSVKDLDPERVKQKRKSGWEDICRFRYTFLKSIRSPSHVVEWLMLS